MTCGDLLRQYSLCGDPADTDRWSIAVLHEVGGRGGSRFVHETLAVGDEIRIGLPRNNFDFDPAGRCVFIAGGIGITPLLPMIRAASSRGVEWSLIYGGRTCDSMAFADELSATYGDAVTLVPENECGRIDLDAAVAPVVGASGGDVYCCGPEGLLTAVQERCAGTTARLHIERFTPVEVDTRADSAFEVELAVTGSVHQIPADRSILSVLEADGVNVLYSCTEGTCGTCETGVISGEVEHRDALLTEDERDAGDVMFICVSRARCPRLVLDM
ncbi:PDR/VanB family oxidoreductase [Gordonia jinhuaensis]|uniref:Ferredoxin n=1 Tax=Gordonia jinhuaensis TaxID=1517702 RepID=A0A916TAW7_9ACTN|nr:PDR/VanB family oxidoreductase [Gordonia jinhuaensis]GGB38442.1 ferredoxin [Gordonia jinhuaensis]